MIVRAGGAIWLNPFAMVLFSVCSAVTVECCVLYPCCRVAVLPCCRVAVLPCCRVALACLLLCKEEGSSPVSLQLLRGGIWVHLALWYVLLVCHQYDVCENSVGSVYVGGYGGSERKRTLCLL